MNCLLSYGAGCVSFVASGLWAFFLVLVLVVCPLLLFLVVLGVHPVAAWFAGVLASCLLVVPVLVVCAFDPWLSWFVASCGGGWQTSELLCVLCVLCCWCCFLFVASGLWVCF